MSEASNDQPHANQPEQPQSSTHEYVIKRPSLAVIAAIPTGICVVLFASLSLAQRKPALEVVPAWIITTVILTGFIGLFYKNLRGSSVQARGSHLKVVMGSSATTDIDLSEVATITLYTSGSKARGYWLYFMDKSQVKIGELMLGTWEDEVSLMRHIIESSQQYSITITPEAKQFMERFISR